LLIVLLVSAVALVGLLYAGKAQSEIAFLFFAFLVGFGGGAFYPMFARSPRTTSARTTTLATMALSTVPSCRFGRRIGVGASVIDKWDYTGAYWLAAACALLSAGSGLPATAGSPRVCRGPSTVPVGMPMAATLAD